MVCANCKSTRHKSHVYIDGKWLCDGCAYEIENGPERHAPDGQRSQNEQAEQLFELEPTRRHPRWAA